MTLSSASRPPLEIERKYLVRRLPERLDAYPCSRIEQGYLAVTDDGLHVRVRRKDEARLLTVKQGQGGTRVEVELPIDPASFEALWGLTEGRRVVKRRYHIPHGPHVVELDVFDGRHEGLLLAEVEFGSEAAARAFEAPDWFGAEVTADARYLNASLARDGLSALRDEGGA